MLKWRSDRRSANVVKVEVNSPSECCGRGVRRRRCRPCSRCAPTWWSVWPILSRLAVVVWLWMRWPSRVVAVCLFVEAMPVNH